jgi:hypothetical protein
LTNVAVSARSVIRLYGAEREESRKNPLAPSPKNRIPACWMRRIVIGAAPLVTTAASTGLTIPMSLARIERTGPTVPGMSE